MEALTSNVPALSACIPSICLVRAAAGLLRGSRPHCDAATWPRGLLSKHECGSALYSLINLLVSSRCLKDGRPVAGKSVLRHC